MIFIVLLLLCIDELLNAQPKQIQEMTRRGVYNSILANRQKITDEVTYFHSNDVYVGYDLIVTGEESKKKRGKDIILGILDVFGLIEHDPSVRKQEISFFLL